ncbi:MAG TPA: hypothetical protein VHE35_34235, partial [Kofleriaceae bacterium]|nr:hypothetical protein [Kofleriaceae bacterium]
MRALPEAPADSIQRKAIARSSGSRTRAQDVGQRGTLAAAGAGAAVAGAGVAVAGAGAAVAVAVAGAGAA